MHVGLFGIARSIVSSSEKRAITLSLTRIGKLFRLGHSSASTQFGEYKKQSVGVVYCKRTGKEQDTKRSETENVHIGAERWVEP